MNIKSMITAWTAVASLGAFAAGYSVKIDSIHQRYPWNNRVDVGYTLSGIENGKEYSLTFGLVRNSSTNWFEIPGAPVANGPQKAAADLNVFNVPELLEKDAALVAELRYAEPRYCVVDLSEGSAASEYPVTYLSAVPSGGWTDEYKTTKLVLRKIPAGSYIMQADQTDEAHRVTLTKDFYLGVFEVTQKQYIQVMGDVPKTQNYGTGDTYPVYYVSYNAVRGTTEGTNWPAKATVDAASFMGVLRAKAKLDFDLPTEAQWEYACRAGTTNTYYWGKSMDGNYCWYTGNSFSKTHPVGVTMPNAWGLYDMSGNVWEWTLDWYNSTLTYGTDPKGSASGSYRVYRGGSWLYYATYCTSSYRDYGTPSDEGSIHGGFRVCRILP